MSFRDLKKKFEDAEVERASLDVFRRLYLECLFEINGNLDTIAIAARAQVEQADRLNTAAGSLTETIERFRELMLKGGATVKRGK